jgi:hypothetical protein
MKAPPFLPEETLQRVLRMANFNGLSVMAISGFLTLAVASNGDVFGVVIGLLVAASGAMELHGAGLLRVSEPRGTRWLIASQPYLALVVLVYCGIQVTNYDPALLRKMVTEEQTAGIVELGYDREKFLHTSYMVSYGVLAVVTVIYQGALTVFYFRRRHVLEEAVLEEDIVSRFQ